MLVQPDMSQTFRHFFPGISISLIYAIAIKKIGVSNISRGLCMIRHQSGGDEKKKKTDGGITCRRRRRRRRRRKGRKGRKGRSRATLYFPPKPEEEEDVVISFRFSDGDRGIRGGRGAFDVVCRRRRRRRVTTTVPLRLNLA